MKLHPLIAASILTAIVALQAWSLKEIVALKVSMATLTVEVQQLHSTRLAFTP